MKRLIACMFLLTGLVTCTSQDIAKNWGGSTTIQVPANKKLMFVTWKDENLWLLLRDRKAGEQPEKFELKESSSWGMMQGTVNIVEQ